MPARFIIDKQSVIRSAAVDPDYTVRPEPENTVKSLAELASVAQAV
jgi:peroxiredoxin